MPSSKVDYSVGEDIFMLPSDMNLNIGNVKGYNNEILVSGGDFVLGTNSQINHLSLTKTQKHKTQKHKTQKHKTKKHKTTQKYNARIDGQVMEKGNSNSNSNSNDGSWCWVVFLLL